MNAVTRYSYLPGAPLPWGMATQTYPTLGIGVTMERMGRSMLGLMGNLEGCAWGAEVRTGGPTLAYSCPLHPLHSYRNC